MANVQKGLMIVKDKIPIDKKKERNIPYILFCWSDTHLAIIFAKAFPASEVTLNVYIISSR